MGENIERVAFAWSAESEVYKHSVDADDLELGEPEYGQPLDEMRLYPKIGEAVRLIVVPPEL